MSEFTLILDEYDAGYDDWSTPSNLVIESLQMDTEEVAAFNRQLSLWKRGRKNK